jgi:ABC-type multidrug transport system fused ATPase/permease subunit
MHPIKQSSRAKVRVILKNYKIIWNWLIYMIICSLIIQVAFLAYPFISKNLISIIEKKWTLDELSLVFIFWALYVVITLFGDFIIRLFNNRYKAQFSNALYDKYRKKISWFDIKNIVDLWTGKLISRFEQWVDAEKNIFFDSVDTLIICWIRWLWVLVLYLYYDYKLFLAMVIVLLLYLCIERILQGKIEKLWDEEREIYEQKSSNLVRYLGEFQTIKINNKTQLENDKFNDLLHPLLKLSAKKSYRVHGKEFIMEAIFDVWDKAIIFYFGYIALTSWYSIASIYMLSNFIRWFWWPLSQFINSISNLQYNLSKYTSLQEFLNSPQDIINWEKHFNYKKGEIVFKDVSFSYNPERAIISDFSLYIPAGKTTALVGNSGSGKSTLIKLILRLYDTQKWEVIIDNQNIKDIQIESFYDNVGYLTQEPAVFDGSIYENMMYGAQNSNPHPLLIPLSFREGDGAEFWFNFFSLWRRGGWGWG